MTELHYSSLTDVCQRMKSGELSSVRVTEQLLQRIQRLDGDLNSYACTMGKQALAQAEGLDARRRDGLPLGLLHGVPLAVKDLLNTADVVTASGTRVMCDFVPDSNAAVVDRLERAGAVVVGKTQLTEGAFSAYHPDIDPPVNPWSVEHWAGVSSSGSGVSVAAGLAYGALGTDTGGSIRFPSACCGLVGIKPTFGRVSKRGAFPLAASLDHIGPITRCVADAARILQVIAGHDSGDPTTLGDAVPNYGATLGREIAGLVVGVDWAYVETGVTSEVVQTVQDAIALLTDLGASVREVVIPDAYRDLVQGWSVTCGVECARAHRKFFPDREDDYGGALAALIRLGLRTPPEEYARLDEIRQKFRASLDDVFEQIDAFVAPCMPASPPLCTSMLGGPARPGERQADWITFTAPFDYSGHPTITLPAGLDVNGLPKSFQLVGRRLGEPVLMQMGLAFERALDLCQHPLL